MLFFVSLFAEFIANDKPFLILMNGRAYFPAVVTYPETTFGGDFETAADYRDPFLQDLIAKKGGTIDLAADSLSLRLAQSRSADAAPSPPTWKLTDEQCQAVVQKKISQAAATSNTDWLGTDDQAATWWRG